MSKNNLKLILFLLSVIMVGAVYMYVYKPNKESTDATKSECESLEKRLKDLREKDKNRAQYEQDIVAYNEGIQDIIAYYPADFDQEV